MLVYCPGKLAIQLPCHKSEANGAHTNDDGNGYQVGHDAIPELGLNECKCSQSICSIKNLIELNGSVYEDGQVHGDQTNNLNGVFGGKSIVYKHELVNEGKNKQTEVGGNGSGQRRSVLAVRFGRSALQIMSESDEDVTVVMVSTTLCTLCYGSVMLQTYLSRPSATAACTKEIPKKDQVHREFGI